MFLTQKDLIDLTGGLSQHAAQRRWLAANGIKFLVGADGSPRVLTSQIEAMLGSVTHTKRRAEPNYSALEKYMSVS